MIEDLVEQAKNQCPTCYAPISDKPTEFPVARIPNDFLISGEKRTLRRIGQSYETLVNLLTKGKDGWRFIHPETPMGTHDSFIEFTSASMRLSCTDTGVVAEYIVVGGDQGFADISEVFLVPSAHSMKLSRFFLTEGADPDSATYVNSEDIKRIGQFFVLPDAVPNGTAVKRVIVSKPIPCRANFSDLAGFAASQKLRAFH